MLLLLPLLLLLALFLPLLLVLLLLSLLLSPCYGPRLHVLEPSRMNHLIDARQDDGPAERTAPEDRRRHPAIAAAPPPNGLLARTRHDAEGYPT